MSQIVPVSIVPEGLSPNAIRDSLPSHRLFYRKAGAELPLTQLQAWITQEALFFHCTAFETAPPEESVFLIQLYPQGLEAGACLMLEITPVQFCCWTEGEEGKQEAREVAEFYRDGGENLEGVFWGGTVRIPVSVLVRLAEGFQVRPGQRMTARLEKYCTVPPWLHRASLFDPEQGGLGELLLTEY